MAANTSHMTVAEHLQYLLEHAGDLLKRTETLLTRGIPGARKLIKKINAEHRYLSKLKTKLSTIDSHQLNSSNLIHIEGIVENAESSNNVSAILKPFCAGNISVTVDIVCDHSATWKKIVARKADALHLVWVGEAQYGQKNILDQATEYLSCASTNQVHFKSPSVEFVFYKGVTHPMAAALEGLGVIVTGDRVFVSSAIQEMLVNNSDDSEGEGQTFCDRLPSGGKGYNRPVPVVTSVDDNAHSCMKQSCDLNPCLGLGQDSHALGFVQITSENESHCDTANFDEESSQLHDVDVSNLKLTEIVNLTLEDVQVCLDFNDSIVSAILEEPIGEKINLDVSALIAMVSALTHGRCHFIFKEVVLTEQAAWEREDPVMPKILKFIKGKKLYSCQTAVSDFIQIINTIGGPTEKFRARKLLQQVTMVIDGISKRAEELDMSGKVKTRSKTIFGFGDAIEAVTLTANTGFHRAALGQGVDFAIFSHGSRALTEKKEKTAKPLQED